jgi:hypothetical protein
LDPLINDNILLLHRKRNRSSRVGVLEVFLRFERNK